MTDDRRHEADPAEPSSEEVGAMQTQTDTTTRPEMHRVAWDPEMIATLEWLDGEFPGWDFSVETTTSWRSDERPVWIARRDGHHPQAELSAAKLHTRLSEYIDRERRRQALSN